MKRVLPLALALIGCAHHPNPSNQSTHDAASTPTPPVDASNQNEHSNELEQALDLAWPDAPLDRAGFERITAAIGETHDPILREARLFAAVRRAPPSEVARLAALTAREDASTLARALAGRPADHPIAELPRPLIDLLTQAHPDTAAATVVSRFHLRPPEGLAPQPLLAAASDDDQLAGARLLSSPAAPLPEPALYDVLDPALLPALARSLGGRSDVPPTVWTQLLATLAQRVQLAPRRWANAWRAVRDAAPMNRPEVQAALVAAVAVANRATGLPPATASWLRCENAAALDKLTAWPSATLACAAEGHAWIGAVFQAEVLGASPEQPGRRANALARLVDSAQGQPHVLEAVATAAVALAPSASGALVRRIARERDPGVEAALLEALVAHPQHALTLADPARHDLLHAPFEQPEGPSLEARVQALELARRLHLEATLPPPRDTAVRAIRLAASPDAGVGPLAEPGPAPLPPVTTLRITTDAGPFEITVDPAAAPRAVETLLAAAREHRYDGLDFHRVVPGFVAQGGDPRGDGYGGTDHPTPTELSMRPFDRGAVGVPLAGLDTGGIQFFVVLADAPHLDARYPWLGRVTRGIEVVDGLLPGDRILSIVPVEPPR